MVIEKPDSNDDQQAIHDGAKQPSEPTPLWTVDEVASYLRLMPETVRAMVRRRELPAIRIGRVYRFHAKAIHDWVQKREKTD